MQRIQSSDCVMFFNDDFIDFRRAKNPNLPVVIFVFGLVSFLLLAFGIVQSLLTFTTESASLMLGAIFTAVGIGLTIVTGQFLKLKRNSNLAFREDLESICSIDLVKKELFNSSGLRISTISEMNLKLKSQLTSSSKKLVVDYPNGTVTLINGNPFAGGTKEIQQKLRSILPG